MASRQSFAKNRRDFGMVVNRGTLRRRWIGVQKDAGIGRAVRNGAEKMFCMVRRRMNTGKRRGKTPSGEESCNTCRRCAVDVDW